MSPNFEMGQPFEKMVQNFENGLIFSALHLQMTHVWFSRGQYFEQRTDKYDLTIEFWRMVKNLPAFVPSVFRPCVCKMCKIAVRWYAEFPDIPKTPSTPHISTIYSRCPKDIPKIGSLSEKKTGLGVPPETNSAVFLNIVQTAVGPPPLVFEHCGANFFDGFL